MRNQSEGDFFFKIGVDDLILFAFLPSNEDFFAGVVIHEDAAAFFLDKTFALNLPAIDKRESEPIGKEGAEFFH